MGFLVLLLDLGMYNWRFLVNKKIINGRDIKRKLFRKLAKKNGEKLRKKWDNIRMKIIPKNLWNIKKVWCWNLAAPDSSIIHYWFSSFSREIFFRIFLHSSWDLRAYCIAYCNNYYACKHFKVPRTN